MILCMVKPNDLDKFISVEAGLIDYVKNINEVQSSPINKLTLELIIPLYLDYQKGLNENNI